MKVIGVGLNKTGTSTLGVCLRHWGLKHISCNQEAFELWRNRRYDELLKWIDGYDSFEDWPWPLIYREIDERFPGTKFILTRRKDAYIWYRSLCKHAGRTGPTHYRKYVYGYEMPHNHKEEHIAFYEKHLDAARSYFRGRSENFVELCWEEGDGWDQLSSFLGFRAPGIPFPHANKSPTAADQLVQLTKRVTGRLLR